MRVIVVFLYNAYIDCSYMHCCILP